MRDKAQGTAGGEVGVNNFRQFDEGYLHNRADSVDYWPRPATNFAVVYTVEVNIRSAMDVR